MVPRRVGAERAPRKLMRRWLRAGACVLALGATVVACDGGSERAEESTTTRGTDATSTTSAPSTTVDTTSVTVGIICTTPEDAVSTVVQAWGVDDRAAAERCAVDAVVNRLFQASGVGNTWIDQGCDRSDPSAPKCAYSYEGGAAFLTTEGSDADGWKVTRLEYLAD